MTAGAGPRVQDGPIAILAGGAGRPRRRRPPRARCCRTRTSCVLADQAYAPYAARPPRVVVDRVVRLADDLVGRGREGLVLASAAATGDALAAVRARVPAACPCSASTARCQAAAARGGRARRVAAVVGAGCVRGLPLHAGGAAGARRAGGGGGVAGAGGARRVGPRRRAWRARRSCGRASTRCAGRRSASWRWPAPTPRPSARARARSCRRPAGRRRRGRRGRARARDAGPRRPRRPPAPPGPPRPDDVVAGPRGRPAGGRTWWGAVWLTGRPATARPPPAGPRDRLRIRSGHAARRRTVTSGLRPPRRGGCAAAPRLGRCGDDDVRRPRGALGRPDDRGRFACEGRRACEGGSRHGHAWLSGPASGGTRLCRASRDGAPWGAHATVEERGPVGVAGSLDSGHEWSLGKRRAGRLYAR